MECHSGCETFRHLSMFSRPHQSHLALREPEVFGDETRGKSSDRESHYSGVVGVTHEWSSETIKDAAWLAESMRTLSTLPMLNWCPGTGLSSRLKLIIYNPDNNMLVKELLSDCGEIEE